jgi:hypothetical protein
MQLVLLEMLQQGTAMAVHDALRNTGGARREHDEQRVIEGQRRKIDLGGSKGGDEVRIAQAVSDPPHVGGLGEVGNHHGVGHTVGIWAAISAFLAMQSTGLPLYQ